ILNNGRRRRMNDRAGQLEWLERHGKWCRGFVTNGTGLSLRHGREHNHHRAVKDGAHTPEISLPRANQINFAGLNLRLACRCSVFVITQLCSMFISLSMAALVFAKIVQPWHIIALAVLSGITMAFDMPARQSFVIEMTSREDLMNAISLNSSAFNCARIVGPSIAGLLMAHISIAACFLCDGLSFIPVIAGLLLMRLPKKETQIASGRGPIGQALEGFGYVWNHRRVLTILALFTVVGVFGWSYSVLMPAFAHDVLHLGANGYGYLMAGSGVGALIAALTVASAGHMWPTRTMALGGVWIFSTALVVFAYTQNLY